MEAQVWNWPDAILAHILLAEASHMAESSSDGVGKS